MVQKERRHIKRFIGENYPKDVITFEEYGENAELYRNTNTAVELPLDSGQMVILPHRAKGDGRPGIYDEGVFAFIQPPTEEELPTYAVNANNVIDLSDSGNIVEYMEKHRILKDIETETLVAGDNVTVLPYLNGDTPEKRVWKEAFNAKHCNADSYESRFGKNYPNEKRSMMKETISMEKLKLLSDNYDMEVEIRIRDKSPDVANPMGKEIVRVITGGIYNDIV